MNNQVGNILKGVDYSFKYSDGGSCQEKWLGIWAGPRGKEVRGLQSFEGTCRKNGLSAMRST